MDQALNQPLAYHNQLGQSAISNNYVAVPIRVTLDDESVQRIVKALARMLQSPPDPSIT